MCFNYYFFHDSIKLFILLYPEVNHAHDVGAKMENIGDDIGSDNVPAGFGAG